MYQPSITKTLKDLKTNKAKVFHDIDANHLENLPEHEKPFDCIVWQFPHAGFPEEEKNEHRGPGFEWGDDFTTRHTDLLKAFF